MSRSIADDAARAFAGRFHNALAFGLPVSQAFEDAKLRAKLASGDDAEPRLDAAEAVDISQLCLVRPPDER